MDSQSTHESVSIESTEAKSICTICDIQPTSLEMITGCKHSFCTKCLWEWVYQCYVDQIELICPCCYLYQETFTGPIGG